MQTFIDKTADYLFTRFPVGLENVCVVFPNRRAELFLKESLSAKISKPVWMPSVMSIEDFVFHLSGYKHIDPVRLRFDLYDVYLTHEKRAPQPFYEFLNWADVLLKDFSDADMALADPDKLFGYLSEAKALSLWNPEGTPLTDFQLKYLHFYSSLSIYYNHLKEKLLDKDQVYQGLAFRVLAEKFLKERIVLPWEFIVFAGFNALSRAEEQIVRSLSDWKVANLLWDADSYYLDDQSQEAGHYLRKNLKTFTNGEINWVGNYFRAIPKSIEIIGVPQNVAQVKLCGQILKELMNEGIDPGKTAVILNDETLLIPLLTSLPPEMDDFNVTMGFPLKNTPLFGFINHLFSLNENALKFNRGENGEIRFFYSDLISFADHHYFAELLETWTGKGRAPLFADWLTRNNKTFITFHEIIEILSKSAGAKDVSGLTVVLKPWGNDIQLAIRTIAQLLNLLKDLYLSDKEREKDFQNKLELEYIFRFSSVLQNLGEMVTSIDHISDLKTFRMVFNQMIQSVIIPFYGEPLKGTQIMGMLETRSLDFEYLIMLSVNDDHIPMGKTDNSFIPVEVKHHFQLPSFKERNTVVAYHFYRLLQRAKRVFFLYNTEPGVLSGGDKSRFILQLQHELKSKSPQSQVGEKVVELPVVQEAEIPLSIAKSNYVIDRLHQIAEKGFSASSLNAYRRCSLQFFYRYIAGIEEPRELEETLEESTLGSVVHNVLEELYEPAKGKSISVKDIQNMSARVPLLLDNALAKHFTGGETRFGKNLLIVKVAHSLIINFLAREAQNLAEYGDRESPLIVVDLEKQFTTWFHLPKGSVFIPIKLIGYFDRIDLFGETTRIIDYKTGKVEPGDLKFGNWDDLLHDSNLDKCFQLLFYLYLYHGNNPNRIDKVDANIISLRNLSAGPLRVSPPEHEAPQQLVNKMEDTLKTLFSDLFDTQKGFTKTEKKEDCRYCSFKSVCNR
jgi:ATP-dependent helicase/nuclease subunit B